MKTLSIEYCHIYPGKNEKVEIKFANEWMPRVMKMFPDYKVQKCIMLDDIHTNRNVNDDYIKKIVNQLEVKPDCIYAESEFIFEARQMVDLIDPTKVDFIHSAEETWLRENMAKYKTSTEFLLSWKNNKGGIEFSCPSLAAASYLTRLGYINEDGVEPIFGDPLMKADHVLNILPSYYIRVEDKAQTITEATYKKAVNQIQWFFY